MVDWAGVLDGRDLVPHDGHHAGARAGHGGRGTREAIAAAKAHGVGVSIDLNYRKKLWSTTQAQAAMRPMVQGIDLVIANEEDIQAVLGLEVAAHRRHRGRARCRQLPRGGRARLRRVRA